MQINKHWLNNPIVAEAARRADLDPLSTLETLRDMLNELEEACPGVPFGEMLDAATGEAPPDATSKVAGMLLDRGLTPDEVDGTVGSEARLHLARKMYDDGASLTSVANRCGYSRTNLISQGLGLSRSGDAFNRLEAARQMLDDGNTVAATAAALGVAERTLYRYLAGKMPAAKITSEEPRWLTIARHYAEHHDYRRTMEELGVKSKGYIFDSHKRAKQEGRL